MGLAAQNRLPGMNITSAAHPADGNAPSTPDAGTRKSAASCRKQAIVWIDNAGNALFEQLEQTAPEQHGFT